MTLARAALTVAICMVAVGVVTLIALAWNEGPGQGAIVTTMVGVLGIPFALWYIEDHPEGK